MTGSSRHWPRAFMPSRSASPMSCWPFHSPAWGEMASRTSWPSRAISVSGSACSCAGDEALEQAASPGRFLRRGTDTARALPQSTPTRPRSASPDSAHQWRERRRLLASPRGSCCTGPGTMTASAERRTQIEEEFMSVSKQVDALQKRAEDLKSSADQARHETNEQIKARIDKAKADITARQDAVKAKAGQAAEHAQGQWKSMKADAAAKTQDLRDRMDRQRDERDARKAERQAEAAEEDAADALDYALWVIDQAEVAVLDAIDARSWADAQAAASPPS